MEVADVRNPECAEVYSAQEIVTRPAGSILRMVLGRGGSVRLGGGAQIDAVSSGEGRTGGAGELSGNMSVRQVQRVYQRHIREGKKHTTDCGFYPSELMR